MLGLQETKSAGSPKTYSCVACSTTFHNLSSLLVHQATHASEISCQTESTLPTCINCGSLFASKDLLEKHHCIMAAPPTQSYICECGEEFSGFTALEEHKKQHGPENKDKLDLSRIATVPDSKIDFNQPVSSQVFHSLSPSYSNEKSFAESALPISNADIEQTESSVDNESSILKPFESQSVTEAQVQIPEKDTIKSSTAEVEEQVQINEMDNFKSSSVVREDQVQICDMETSKFSEVEGEVHVVREEEVQQNFEMDTLKSFDVVGAEKMQILYMDTLKSSNVVGEEQVQILEKDDLKSSNVVGEEQVKIFEKDHLKTSNVVGEEQMQILEKDTLNVVNHSVHDNEKSPESCGESTAISKKSILKMLASAYMTHKQPVLMKQRNLPPRKVAPRAPLQPPTAMTISKLEPLENQSNMRKDTVVSMRTGKMSPKKPKIISVTQTLCPVVVLETRQKLFGRDNIEGKLQCRLCRRVFQNVDSMIMHHALHKKERVKFCLSCQEFVITVISVPENHVCYDALSRNSQPLGNKPRAISPIAQQLEKMFYCSLCKRGYTRRHRLKIHNCPYKASLKSLPTIGNQGSVNPRNTLEEQSKSQKQDSKANQMSTQHINIGVGTEPIKIEEQNTEHSIEKQNQPGMKMQLKDQINPVKSIFTSVSNSNPPESTKNSEVPANIVEMKAEEKDKLVEKQWTMPLDDAEIDILIDVDQNDSDEDDFTDVAKDDCDDDVVVVELSDDKEINTAEPGDGFQVHVTNKGVKRFVCNGCQRSYSRLFTLKEHLKICEARMLKEQTVENASSDLPLPIKRFPCPRCGKFISRKDNLNKHVKKCRGPNTIAVVSSRTVESKTKPTAQENLFVLSPSTENQAAQHGSTQNSSSSRNWGIMSLPSVLPRRVTCECGASFTCPRLLFEHLQVHAQESYICPHCGENLQSWMDFEAHQQLHNQSKIPANEPRGSQQKPRSFSQTVPSRVTTRPQQSTGFSALNIKAQPPALLSPQHVNHRSIPETWSCPKCKKNFSLRSSLLRHIRLRCKGDTAGQRKYTCSRCGAMFHNPVTLKVHIQSNTCKPAFKPIRCPVCVRWFSCLDGLKRHLVSHSRQAGVTCQICDHNCPTPQALEEHKRNVHGVVNRMRPEEDAQEPLSQAVTQSSSSTSTPTPTPTPFQCPICLRNYPKLQSLKDHLRKVHRPKQPTMVPVEPVRSGQFQCQICSRFYFTIKSLKNHRRRVHRIVGTVFQPSKGTEQNNTPNQFQCHICSRSYPDVQSLRNHRRRVHRIVGGLELSRGMAQHNLFKCQICQRSYPDIASLKNHTRRVHRILGPVPETSMMLQMTRLNEAANDTDDDLEQKPIPFLHS